MTARLMTAWPWVLVIVGLVGMAPGLAQRADIEARNTTYELTVAYPELTAMALGGIDLDTSLPALRDAGLTSVAVDMQTIRDLEREGDVTLLGRADLLSLLLLSGEPASAMPTEGDAFILVADDDGSVVDRIRRAAPAGDVEQVTVAGQRMYQISGIEGIASLPLGYDHAQLRELTDHGLDVIARLPITVSTVEFAIDELAAVRDDLGVDRLIVAGDSAPFITDPDALEAFGERLRELGFAIALIEFSPQTGVPELADVVGAVRLRNVGLAPDLPERTISDAARAVRERNIRILFFRANPTLAADDRLDLLASGIRQIVDAVPAEFDTGVAAAPDALEPSTLHVAGAVAAAAGFGAAAGALLAPALALAGAAGLGVLALGSMTTDVTLLGDAARLGVAGLAAVLAIAVARPRRRLLEATGEYVRACLVVFAGGLTVAGLAFDAAFLVAARDFWGVKALLIGPPVIVAAAAAYLSLGRPSIADAMPILNLPVRMWHVIAAGVVGAAVGLLLLRSGNSSFQIDVELFFREQLESFFAIRPRTKEFLLGFPALLTAIVAAATWRHGWWLYVVAAIATASAVDTFTHFHSPLLVSVLRTAFGMVLGFAFGLVALFLLRLVARAGSRLHRSRSGRLRP